MGELYRLNTALRESASQYAIALGDLAIIHARIYEGKNYYCVADYEHDVLDISKFKLWDELDVNSKAQIWILSTLPRWKPLSQKVQEDPKLESENWLYETYRRSPNKCRRIDLREIKALAEMTAAINQRMGSGSTDSDELYEDYLSPFLSNVKAIHKELYRAAAKMSGVEVRFGPSTCGSEEYLALYSDQKGQYDLSEFWNRAVELQSNALTHGAVSNTSNEEKEDKDED
jgi:hypothetical protein